MSTGLLFITAPEADHKAINRLLLYLRDIEFESGDRFKLITTRNAYDLEPPPGQSDRNSTTEPPVPANIDNAWAGESLQSVEGYVLDLNRDVDENRTNDLNPTLFILLDVEGLKDKTCVLAERIYDYDADEKIDAFSKVRLPWDQAYVTFCNLDIANMNFEEFCVDEDPDEDHWYQFGYSDWQHAKEEAAAKRDEQIAELEREGQA